MHDIEPYWNWRDKYTAESDDRSPFFNREYSEFTFSNKVYNYFIHPQWDAFGSPTLYTKILFADYDHQYAILELIGEWNDSLHNDIMFFKREVIDQLIHQGIYKFIVIGENVLNYHGDDNSYYEEWAEDIQEYGGWVTFINLREHVIEEMGQTELQYYMHFDPPFNSINWRVMKPPAFFTAIDQLVFHPKFGRLPG